MFLPPLPLCSPHIPAYLRLLGSSVPSKVRRVADRPLAEACGRRRDRTQERPGERRVSPAAQAAPCGDSPPRRIPRDMGSLQVSVGSAWVEDPTRLWGPVKYTATQKRSYGLHTEDGCLGRTNDSRRQCLNRRSLGVDYAPALVGFELQGGRMLPKIQGVVICEEYEAQVVAAYIEKETAKQEALTARRLREARAAWAHLIQSVRTRLQLKGRYEGTATGEDGGAIGSVNGRASAGDVPTAEANRTGTEMEGERG